MRVRMRVRMRTGQNENENGKENGNEISFFKEIKNSSSFTLNPLLLPLQPEIHHGGGCLCWRGAGVRQIEKQNENENEEGTEAGTE